jgi:hypothetical protein
VTLLIDVGAVLRGNVCELYSNLLTRPTGAAVRHAIERQVVEVGSPVVTTIDFSQVHLLDVSCADEIIAKLLLRYDEATNPLNGYLLLRGIREDHLDAIDAVLEKRSLALVAWHDGLAELHGIVDTAERSHWETVRDVGPASGDQIALALRADTPATLMQLARLVRRRLLMRRDEQYLVPGMVGPLS